MECHGQSSLTIYKEGLSPCSGDVEGLLIMMMNNFKRNGSGPIRYFCFEVEAAKAIVESKKTDLESNNAQLSELTARVAELSGKCEQVWRLYETRRDEYARTRTTAPADPYAAQDADWGTSNDAWGDSGTQEEAWGDAPTTTATEPVPAAASTPRWRCVYEFTARTVDELSLQPGDLVSDAVAPRGDAEPGWRWGTAREVVEPLETKTQLEGKFIGKKCGKTGIFPCNYVTVDATCAATISSIPEAAEPEPEPEPPQPPQPVDIDNVQVSYTHKHSLSNHVLTME
ncbi:unnamed protein product [Diatraea saccharalis]|uniref:SH3 domain-containing protein n=1 Tax=Diatraea saccharalis TaxID=40085 RepID=A0A9N9WH69_9NEOP|nr:unnamed protein product [Diatraea saccharalis]